MFLSRTAIYALRVLAVLTEVDVGERATADYLSKRTEIPRSYLSKVLRQLAAAGITDAARGHRGGFRLARQPCAISMRDVLSAVRGDRELGRCVFREGPCDLQRPCMLHGVVGDVHEEIARWAERTTLADVCKP